jgi:hypothetical protein
VVGVGKMLEKFDPMADDRTPDQKRGKRLAEIIAETPVTNFYTRPYAEPSVSDWNTSTTTYTYPNTYTITQSNGSTYTYTYTDHGYQITSATTYGGGNGIV